MPLGRHFFAYLLRCSDGSLYAGSTSNLEQRLKTHNEGRGAKWTAVRRPVELVYHEQFPDQPSAVRRERQWKRWTTEKKQALIAGDLARLNLLARSVRR